MTDFVHLHSHDHYSLLDGLNSPLEMAQAAKDIGHTSLAQTNHGTLSGTREHQIACAEVGIKPIIGIEAYLSPTDRFDRRDPKSRADNTANYHHLIILAKDAEGVKNLYRLSEMAWIEGFYSKPRMDKDILAEHRDGLIILSGCMSGVISKAIQNEDPETADKWTRWFKETFDENFYMEIQAHQTPELNNGLLDLADLYSVKPVVTSDCHYANAYDRAIEDQLLIISSKPKKNKDIKYNDAIKMEIFERLDAMYPDRRMKFSDIDVYVNSREDVAETLAKQGIARTDIFENTVAIADSVQPYEFHKGLDLLPIPKTDPLERIKKLTAAGMKKRGLTGKPEYEERLAEEIRIIAKKDFIPYFLVVADMVSFAKKQGILTGPGRGSAAGSLVCYVLGITEVDPIKYNLLFARFINEERNDFPDIDTDFEDRRRKEIKDYLIKKFKHVASISTFGKFVGKGMVRDAARVQGVPLSEVNQALKTVDTYEEYLTSPNTQDFRRKYPEVTELSSKLRGHIRGTGMHAGGIVISREPITNFAPMETRVDPNSVVDERIPVVGLDMNEVADLGLIKLDALGLKALSVIQDTLSLVKDRHGKGIDLLSLDLADPKIYADLSNGFTRGVFQCDATPYTNLLVMMGVDNFESLAASNALVRPGAANTVGAVYISRKKGLSQVTYDHEILKSFTKDTYGVIIYQEQVMQACVYLAGMSWSDADKIRKIIGKKKDVHEFDAYREQFVSGASKHITTEQAEELWHDFEAHADYSFNRSHAVAYSMVSYWTAWLKHYYPIEFMTAALSNEDDTDAITLLYIEAKRLGINILLPHINASGSTFKIEGKSIRVGLGQVKYLSEATAPRITSRAPFENYAAFAELVDTKGSGVNTRMLSSLNAIGAASFPDNPLTGKERDNLYEYLDIPMFNVDAIPASVKLQASKCEDFEEDGVFIMVGMVKKIKRGTGWARVEMIDETGSVGVFHNENTAIEPGKMYVFLIGENRIHRYIEADEFENLTDDPFVRYLNASPVEIGSDKRYFVVDFSNYKTKAGKMMAHTIVSKPNKEMRRVLVFNRQYAKALHGMRPGKTCTLKLGTTDDGALFVQDVQGEVTV